MDSAGLALLVDWWRALERQGAALVLRGAPGQLRALAAVAGLEEVLPFEGPAAGGSQQAAQQVS